MGLAVLKNNALAHAFLLGWSRGEPASLLVCVLIIFSPLGL